MEIIRVGPEDWHRYRLIRLAALAESPTMFGSTHAREREFGEAEWRARTARPATFIASRDGCDVGLAGVHELDGAWNLVSMWVTPEARGTGIVEALASACEDVVRQAGADKIVLGVMEDNPAGCRAYQRLGFVFTGQRDHIRDGRDELWMAKDL